MIANQNPLSFGILLKVMPGPDRKRLPALYQYRITYRNPCPEEVGCVTAWEVAGGRSAYQVALERGEDGELHWHCTCADAVYRGELSPHHICKHVQGLLECIPGPRRYPFTT